MPKIFPQNAPLGRWVVKLRAWRKKNDPRLSASRAQRLDKAGFVWDPKAHPDFWKVQSSNRKAEDLWEERFQELLAYKEENGDW